MGRKLIGCFGALMVCLSIGANGSLWGQFPSENIRLLAHLPLSAIGGAGTRANDIWGWTDPLTGKEYALFGVRTGTSFVDVSDPEQPVYLGMLPTHTGATAWRDMKVYQNHAYVVSDLNGPHGIQIMDLTVLRGVQSPQIFSATAHSGAIREAHNIAINTDSGYAYTVGGDAASGGPVVFDLSNPTNPTIAGQYASDGYTHDAQVVIYHGPDADYVGREIAFNANVDTVTIVDFTDKLAPQQVSRTGYPEHGYTHQGWLSEDHRYFFLNDEFDEVGVAGQNQSRTHLWNMADLDQPAYLGYYEGVATGIDHNHYVKGDYIYQANNASGLRVVRFTDESGALALSEVAFLDTYPAHDDEAFEGAWSVYPFFESGTIIVSDRTGGLFVARLDIADPDFDGDGLLDCADIDQLVTEIVMGTHDPAFDLTVDGRVDLADRDQWLAEAGALNLPAGGTYLLGDADLDGTVDGQDFVLWNQNKFTARTAWCEGDFTADGIVDGRDFLLWNQNKFQTAEAISVPEPRHASVFWGVVWALFPALNLFQARDNLRPYLVT